MADHARLNAYGIDPLDMNGSDNEKLGDLMEDNDRLIAENQQLQSLLSVLRNEAPREGGGHEGRMSDDLKQEMSKMEDELARLMAENADLKTGVRPAMQQPLPRESTPPQAASTGASIPGRSGSGTMGGNLLGGASRLQSQVSGASAASSYAEMEAEYEKLLNDHQAALNQVAALEDQVDELRSARQAAAEAAARKLTAAEVQGNVMRTQLADARETMRRLQNQVSTKQMLGRVGSDAEVAQSDALVQEILQLQSAKSTSFGSAAAAAAAATDSATFDDDAADKKTAVALATLEGLTKQNRQLSKKMEEATANAQATSQKMAALQDSKTALENDLETVRSQLGAKVKTESGRVINKLLARVDELQRELKKSGEKSSALTYSVKLLQGQLTTAEAGVVDRDRLATALDNMKQEMRQLADSKGSDINSAELTKALKEVDLAKARSHLRISEAQEECLAAQEARDAAIERASQLEQSNEELTKSRDVVAAQIAALKQHTVDEAQRWKAREMNLTEEIAELQKRLSAAKAEASRAAQENDSLVTRLQLADATPGRDGIIQGRSSPSKGGRRGSDDVALLQELQLENDKLEVENQRISHTAKELLADKAELLDRLTNVAMESSFGSGLSSNGTPRHAQQLSTGKDFRLFSQSSTLTEGDNLWLPGSPAAPDGHRRSTSNTHTTPLNQTRHGGVGDVAAPRTATQALQALFSQIDDQDSPGNSGGSPSTAPPAAAERDGGGGRASAPNTPSALQQSGLDPAVLLQKHAAQADALAAAGATPEDAARRAALKKRSDSLLRSLDKNKAREPVHRNSNHSRAVAADVPAVDPLVISSRVPTAVPAATQHSNHDAAAVAAAAINFMKEPSPTRLTPHVGISRRQTAEPTSPVESASTEHSAEQSQSFSRPNRSDHHGEATSFSTTAAAAAIPKRNRPPRPLTHSRTTSASESVNSLADNPPGSARTFRGDSISHPPGTPSGTNSSTHDLERAAKLQKWADAKVKAAYAKSTAADGSDGTPEVAVFMRNLGWAFRLDTGGEARQDGALLDTALAITHPSRGRNGSSKDRAVASAAHAKLQEWRRATIG